MVNGQAPFEPSHQSSSFPSQSLSPRGMKKKLLQFRTTVSAGGSLLSPRKQWLDHDKENYPRFSVSIRGETREKNTGLGGAELFFLTPTQLHACMQACFNLTITEPPTRAKDCSDASWEIIPMPSLGRVKYVGCSSTDWCSPPPHTFPHFLTLEVKDTSASPPTRVHKNVYGHFSTTSKSLSASLPPQPLVSQRGQKKR